MTWTRNERVLTNGTDYTISSVTRNMNMYTVTLRVSSLDHGRDNNALYNCEVTVRSNTQFVTGNNSNSSTRLTVEGKLNVMLLYIISYTDICRL